MWLIIICVSSFTISDPTRDAYCTTRGGGITVLRVPEENCRAALAIDVHRTNTFVRCVSPSGEVLDNNPKKTP